VNGRKIQGHIWFYSNPFIISSPSSSSSQNQATDSQPLVSSTSCSKSYEREGVDDDSLPLALSKLLMDDNEDLTKKHSHEGNQENDEDDEDEKDHKHEGGKKKHDDGKSDDDKAGWKSTFWFWFWMVGSGGIIYLLWKRRNDNKDSQTSTRNDRRGNYSNVPTSELSTVGEDELELTQV